MTPAPPLTVSIVVPVLDEAVTIGAKLHRLRRDFGVCEVAVVDRIHRRPRPQSGGCG